MKVCRQDSLNQQQTLQVGIYMNLNDHNRQNKIAVINDMSGFGRCSIAVALPVISHMKIQCCPVPTSIFSNHTGFKEFFFEDYTSKMEEYISNWRKIDLRFKGILSGFLGSMEQIDIVRKFIEDFRNEDTTVIIDPVMGENGTPYPTYTEEMCQEMKRLVKYADVLTPNLTEACILTDTAYTPDTFTRRDYYSIINKLAQNGACKIVITGIEMGNYIGNIVYESGGTPHILKQLRAGHVRSGTGDIFSSIIAADAVHKVDFDKSVRKASRFVRDCISVTEEFDIPPTDGVCFEEILYKLRS